MNRIGIKSFLAVALTALLTASSPGLARPSSLQEDSSSDEQKRKAAERERKAKSLREDAIKNIKRGEYKTARVSLEKLRNQYRNTTYYARYSEEIMDGLFLCGTRVAATELMKQKAYRKPHIDAWHGIQFYPPKSWRGIPRAQEYFGHQDNSEVNYSGQHIRIGRYTSPYLENLYLMVFKLYDVKSRLQLEDTVKRDMAQYFPGLKMESQESLRTRYHVATKRTFKDRESNRLVFYHYYAQKKGFTLVGVWRAQPESSYYAIRSSKKYEVTSADWEKALVAFDKTAKNFWVLPQAQHSAAKKKARLGMLLPGWKRIKTQNYIIEYATRDDYAKKLAKHVERIRAFYMKVIPTGKGLPKCRIKLFDNEEDFHYYGQIPGAAAYWSPSQEEMVAYRFSGDKMKIHDEEMTVSSDRNPEEETFHIMNHEGFHQYMYYLMGRHRGVYVPSWLNEGMGDYFFGGTWKKKKGRVSFEIQPNWWRLKTIIEAVKKEEHVPLERIFQYTQESYYANPEICYAEGWAICYFFLTSPVAKKRGYHTIPRQMIYALQTTGNSQKATKKVLGKYDLKIMEKEWKEFVLSLEK